MGPKISTENSPYPVMCKEKEIPNNDSPALKVAVRWNSTCGIMSLNLKNSTYGIQYRGSYLIRESLWLNDFDDSSCIVAVIGTALVQITPVEPLI